MFEGISKLIKGPDPKEMVRKWQAQLRADQRRIERQIRDIQFEEKKVQKNIKDAAKRNDLNTCKILAKEIVHSRKAVGRLYVNKAQMMSISSALTEQLAMVRVAGSLQKSNEVMKLVNESMKLPELQKTMMEMSKEMQRAGLIDEMMSDAMDSAMGIEDEEEETEAEVQRVLEEVAGEALAAMPKARARPAAVATEEPEEAAEEDLQERLNAMRN